MGLKQQIINNQIEEVADKQNTTEDQAFLIYGHSLILGRGPASFDIDDNVDGGQDKQIDAFTIEEGDGRADVYITQATITNSFSSTKLVQLGSGLRWVFEVSRKEIDKLPNLSLRDKIIQFREVQSELGPANIAVHVNFIANTELKPSDEFMHEKRKIEAEYDNDTFENFSLNTVGVSELIDMSKARDRRARSVDVSLRVKYDTNTPSLINYHSQGLKGTVCTISAIEIAKLVNDHPDGSIFDLNIRQYLGTRGTVNRDIQNTACGDDSYEFWFLNNGITIVCDKYDIVSDPDNPKVMIKNLQIVNGCQTASTIASVAASGKLKKDTFVVVRIYETKDEDLVSKIVLTTNNQNQITSRNLRANDPLQVSMQDAFLIYGYYYERKPRQFDATAPTEKIYTNEEVGQAFLALALKSPSDARSRRYKIWADLNDKVFCGAPIEQYIYSSMVVRKLADWLRNSPHYRSKTTSERILAKRGLYHTARVAAFEILGGDKWDDTSLLKKRISGLEEGTLDTEAIFSDAFNRVAKVIGESEYANDVERGIKSFTTDKKIEAELYSKQ